MMGYLTDLLEKESEKFVGEPIFIVHSYEEIPNKPQETSSEVISSPEPQSSITQSIFRFGKLESRIEISEEFFVGFVIPVGKYILIAKEYESNYRGPDGSFLPESMEVKDGDIIIPSNNSLYIHSINGAGQTRELTKEVMEHLGMKTPKLGRSLSDFGVVNFSCLSSRLFNLKIDFYLGKENIRKYFHLKEDYTSFNRLIAKLAK